MVASNPFSGFGMTMCPSVPLCVASPVLLRLRLQPGANIFHFELTRVTIQKGEEYGKMRNGIKSFVYFSPIIFNGIIPNQKLHNTEKSSRENYSRNDF